MNEHTDARTPDHGPRRELTEEEAKFIGADPETRHEAPARSRHEGHEHHEGHDHHEGHEHHAHEGHEHHEGHAHDEVREPGEAHEAHARAEVREHAEVRETHERHTAHDPHAGHAHAEGTATAEPASRGGALFPTEEAESLRTRWDGIQTEFVDEPRSAVEKADALVGDVMQRLADGFSAERGRLEREWDRGDSVSTEDLRVALKRYRSFFDRLLSV